MGIEESKVLERKASKTKSNLSQKSLTPQDISDFVSQLSTLACLRSTPQTTYEYATFQKLPFTGHYAALPLCSNISTNYSSVFICYDCCTDDHAYLCQSCFQKGNHDSHRFSVFVNNDGWRLLFCRCGDDQYMKKKTICETHIQAPKIVNQTIDKKDMAKFSVYFNQTFKVLFGLMQKRRQAQLIASVFAYLQKITEGNLYFSKVVTEFFLQKNVLDGESTNLKKFISMGGLNNSRWYSIFRNLNFASEYKIQVIREMINGANQATTRVSSQFYELLLNFTGKISILSTLAKQQNLIITCSPEYYNLLIKTGADLTEIWKCIVRNKQISLFSSSSGNIIMTIIRKLVDDQESIWQILEQLLVLKNQSLNQYILACLMIQVPEYFIPSYANKKKNSKTNISKYDKLFSQYYSDIFFKLNTHCQGQAIPSTMLLLLPYFSFGEPMINKFWQQVQKRVQVISKNKERKVIKEASSNVFQLISSLLELFMTWDHKVLRDAAQMEFKNYTKDAKLVERLLVQFLDKTPKIPRQQMLDNIDCYTQKQRNLAKDVIKKNLRYNAKKGKYYNISKKLPNNSYNFEDLNIGAPLKLTEWQQFISKKFFTSSFYRMVPAIIKIAQKALMEDIEMVKTVANISVCVCILNKSERNNMKEVTRNFIKQIPDVREDIYYILAKIRDRLELDIDDIEQSGKKGTKKAKLDLITQIRDKKFKELKLRQEKMRAKWLKQAEKLQSDGQEQNEQNICCICKQKDTDKRRFVYPCNFTRNNVISTMLHSEVTDLDINICLHKVHEDCFQRVRRKGQCPVCKFLINCYVPEKPLAEQSYTKNWLRNFENIVTSINMQSGKSFNSDWATIFMTYLVFSKSFKVLLNSTQIQEKQRLKANELILLHYKSQLQKWPELTKQALKRAEKTVKGQVRRQSNNKKVVKTLVLDLVLLQITAEPFKNAKRVQKKFRELINIIGSQNAEKIQEGFAWSRDNQAVKQIFSSNIATDVDQLFKIRNLPEKAADYLLMTSIKCPMCNKYQPSTWQCLFCQKISCQNCINPRNHCEVDHKGSGIILHLSNAQYELYHESRQVEILSLYRNQYEQGWTRNQNPEGWTAHTDEIYTFFETILHSLSPFKRKGPEDDNSDNEGEIANRGFSNWNSPNQQIEDYEAEQPDAGYQQVEKEEQYQEPQQQEPEEQEQEQEQEQDQEQQQEQERAPRRKAPKPAARRSTPAKPARRR